MRSCDHGHRSQRGGIMNYEEWLRNVPTTISRDPVFRRTDYRIASYLADEAWEDCNRLDAHSVTRQIAGQLYRAIGSISANISEGYSRSSGRDRARILEYALGS